MTLCWVPGIIHSSVLDDCLISYYVTELESSVSWLFLSLGKWEGFVAGRAVGITPSAVATAVKIGENSCM